MNFHYLLMANHAMVQKYLMKKLSDTDLTPGQPKILDYLGEHNGASQTEIAASCYIEAASLTSALNGMEAKGLVHCERVGRGTSYVPLVERDRSVLAETHSFLNRVYQGSVGMMMSAMVKQEGLSREQIAQLRAILDDAEKEAEG